MRIASCSSRHGNHGEDGIEDLLPRDDGVVVRVAEDGSLARCESCSRSSVAAVTSALSSRWPRQLKAPDTRLPWPVRAGEVPRSQPPGSLPSPPASRAGARRRRTAGRWRHPIRKRPSGTSRRASPGAGHGGRPRPSLNLPVRGSPMCWCATRSTSAPRSRPNRSPFPAPLSSCSRPGLSAQGSRRRAAARAAIRVRPAAGPRARHA